jgi:hypothetical protein
MACEVAVMSGLTGDLDGDGMLDANEVHRYGLTTLYPAGTDFRFR